MNFQNQNLIPIQCLCIEPMHVLNSPDIKGLNNESHSHKCYSQGRDPGGYSKESETYQSRYRNSVSYTHLRAHETDS